MRRQFPGALVAAALVAMLAPVHAHGQAARAERVRVLFLGDNGHHQPARRAKELLPIFAQRGIDIFYTDERDDLSAAELDKYHVLMLYNNHTTVAPAQLNALLEFVRDGGGLVVVHCASASFQNSEEFIRLVGASFLSHGTGTFGVTRTQPDHPAVQGVPAFESWDETYVHTKHNPVGRTVLEVRSASGHAEPWTWVKTYGAGRVYYTAWGHDQRTWGNAGFQDQLHRGTLWSAGDWALTRRVTEPTPQMIDLEMPIPTYRRDSINAQGNIEWNVPGPPVTRAPAAMTTEESLQLSTLRPGFRAEPFAVEPMIGNIIDFTWDERGRMWAVETNDYPNEVLPDSIVVPSAGPYPGGRDRILILEDRDNDGSADNVKVFADGLNLATSIVLGNGGVIVGQAPHMLFFRDTNGDDVADVRQILFTGFPRRDTHGTISNMRWGFDNQILGSVGYNGYIGVVGADTIGRGAVGAGYFRFAPDASSFDYLARTSNNTWGVALSEDGYIFGSTANSRPSTFVHIPGRYYRAAGLREPTLPGIEDRNDVYAIREIWQVDQFDRYTAGAAHELYTARLFPQEYWNRVAFVTEPTAHVIGMFELLPNGSTFTAKNQWNFMASRDPWVAPVQVKVGPDGALWVSDFYTLIAQHNPVPKCCGFRNGRGAAYETPNRDRLHGRIYRILPADAPTAQPRRPELGNAAQVVAALRNDNLFWRLTAQRLLIEQRNLTGALPMLVELASDHTVDAQGLNVGALHALWTLHGLGAFSGGNTAALSAARNALHHPAASVRRAALQVLPRTELLVSDIFAAGLLPDRTLPPGMQLNPSTGVLQDADPHVRLEALIVLSELPASPRTAGALLETLFFPANARDRWIPDAVAIAGVKQGPQFPAAVLARRVPQNMDSVALAGVRSALRTMTQHYASRANVEAVLSMLTALPQANAQLALTVLDAITAPPAPPQQPGAAPQQRVGGWPADSAPVLTAAQRAALVAAHRGVPAELQAGLQQVADRWGMPELFR